MSLADASDASDGDLQHLFDDPDDPRELTVFSTRPGVDLTTAWITIDADHAVPLADAR